MSVDDVEVPGSDEAAEPEQETGPQPQAFLNMNQSNAG